MRPVTLAVCLVIALLSPLAASFQPPTPAAPGAELAAGSTVRIASDLTVRRLREGVFLVRHERPFAANLLLVEMADGTLVLASTPYTPRATRDLLDWMKNVFGQRRIVAINPHYHLDGMGGNQVLRSAGIPVHGSDLTVRLAQERGARILAQVAAQVDDPALRKEIEEITLTPPDQVFKAAEGLTLRFGEQSAIVHFPGPGHSPDHSVVYFPAQSTLFGGCTVRDGFLGNIAEADLAKWPDAMRDLDRFDAEIVIPGHGNPGTRELIKGTVALVEKELEKAARRP